MNTQRLNYLKRKAAGTAKVVKAGAAHALLLRRWDGESGEELPTEQVGYSLTDLEQTEAELLEQLAEVRALIVDTKEAKQSLFELIDPPGSKPPSPPKDTK